MNEQSKQQGISKNVNKKMFQNIFINQSRQIQLNHNIKNNSQANKSLELGVKAITDSSYHEIKTNKSIDYSVSTMISQSPYSQHDQTQTISQLKKLKASNNNDAQLLANRISILKSEESKIINKIEKTKLRAQQILDFKKFQEDKHNSYINAEEEKERIIRAKQIIIYKDRLNRQLQTQERSKTQINLLKENASEVKQLRGVLLEMKEQTKLQEEQTKALKAQEIRSQERQALAKLQKQREQLLKSFEQEHKYNKHKHKIEVEQQEKHLEKMEAAEMLMLNKLQNTQKKEQDVFSSLERAVKESQAAHQQRLVFKRRKNEEIRKNYMLPPTMDYLQDYIVDHSTNYTSSKSNSTLGNKSRNQLPQVSRSIVIQNQGYSLTNLQPL